MKSLTRLLILSAVTLPVAVFSAPTPEAKLEAEAAALNKRAVETLGVDFKSLSLLLQGGPTEYFPKWDLDRSGSWSLLMKLQELGFVVVKEQTALPDGRSTGETFVTYTLTAKGRAVAAGLLSKRPN